MEQQRTELEMLQSIYSSEITVVKEDTEFLVSFLRPCKLIPVIIKMYFHSRLLSLLNSMVTSNLYFRLQLILPHPLPHVTWDNPVSGPPK